MLEELTEFERGRVFDADMKALDECDLCVALLTGADQDAGTSAEIGYLSAKGIPCIGITDDVRGLNNMIWGFCKRGQYVVKRLEDILPLVQQVLK